MFYSPQIRTNQEHKPDARLSPPPGLPGRNAMDATTYLKEAGALLSLLGVIYLWSLLALALQ
jgi:hypothetical protein